MRRCELIQNDLSELSFKLAAGNNKYLISSPLPLSLTDPPPLPSTAFPGICPPDMDEDDNPVNNWLPFKGHCYLFITDEIEWANAASNCVRHGECVV